MESVFQWEVGLKLWMEAGAHGANGPNVPEPAEVVSSTRKECATIQFHKIMEDTALEVGKK